MGSRLEKNSTLVRKRIDNHSFDDEHGEEYEASKFGGFSDYMRRKKIKLQNLDAELRSQSTDKPHIFRGVVAHVNGYTQPSLSDLHALIVSYGGGFQQYLDGKTAVTHVIASSLTPKKKVEFAKYRIVKPAWIVDSVNAGKLLPWDAYRVVDEGVTQKLLAFENGQVVSQVNGQRQGYRDQTSASWYTSQFRHQASVEGAQPQEEPTSESIMDNLDTNGESEDLDDVPNKTTDTEDLAQDHFEIDELAPSDFDLVTGDLDPVRDSLTQAVIEQVAGDDDAAAASVADDTSNVDIIVQKEASAHNRPLTAEEHNAILLSNPHMAKSSTANPDFINQYYRESRLHHLSTWKADLKAQLQARAQEKSNSQKARQKRVPGARRYILHVDFDSFFAAVSLRQSPHLKDKPVVIAHGAGPGSEIASCNYPARKYGVKNGMWMKTALGLCADLTVLPYDFKLYEEASRHFYDSILAIDGIVQSISIDEALIDVSDLCIKAGGSDGRGMWENSTYREQETAEQIAQDLRKAIRTKTGCEVSVGIGNNILLAKVALRKAKPAGQHLIKPDQILDFLGELLVTDLPGVAWSIGNKLEEVGVKYVKDIRDMTKEKIVNTLGPKTGDKLYDYARGIDRQEVGEQVVRKSVSAEINWGIRFINQQQAEDFVQCLCDELSKRLLEQVVKGRQLTMKIMRKAADAGMDPPKNLGHGKCDTFNKSVVLGVATTDRLVIGKEAISILRSYGFSPGELRGLGVQMQKLEPLKPAVPAGASSIASMFDSSQRRLQFKRPAVPAAESSTATPTKRQSSPSLARGPSKLIDHHDPMDEVLHSEEQRNHAGIIGAIDPNKIPDGDYAQHRPLNIAGTQFVLPSQIDPAVLAELPADIRSKLAPKQRSMLEGVAQADTPYIEPKSRSASPYPSDNDLVLPNQSQLDPEIFDALPDDVKQELLSHYRNNDRAGSSRQAQQLLPQSPRKVRPVMASKKTSTTPTKKNRFTPLLAKGRAKTNFHTGSTLTQSNFLSIPKTEGNQPIPPPVLHEDISESFLSELPDDIRYEILAEQKRSRLKTKSGLNITAGKRKIRTDTGTDATKGQQKLQLPGPVPVPTFTSRKLSKLSDLRDAMTAWVTEFSVDGEIGPYTEDVDALGQYLGKVVLEELDMSKAVAVINWLSYVIGEREFHNTGLSAAWTKALARLRDSVQKCIVQRGLAPVAFYY